MAQNKKTMKLSSTFKTPRLLSCFLFVFKGAVYVYFGDRQPWFSILWIRMKENAFEYFPLFRSAIDSTCSNDQRSVVWSFSGKCKHFIEKTQTHKIAEWYTILGKAFLTFTNPILGFSNCSLKRTLSYCINYIFEQCQIATFWIKKWIMWCESVNVWNRLTTKSYFLQIKTILSFFHF